jgi:acyl-CoA dehydrogenase
MSSEAAAGVPRFELSDTQKEYQKLARDFARDVMIPQAPKFDKSMEYPQDIFKQAWELGLVNSHIPESCGGMGLHCMYVFRTLIK